MNLAAVRKDFTEARIPARRGVGTSRQSGSRTRADMEEMQVGGQTQLVFLEVNGANQANALFLRGEVKGCMSHSPCLCPEHGRTGGERQVRTQVFRMKAEFYFEYTECELPSCLPSRYLATYVPGRREVTAGDVTLGISQV